MLKLSCLCFALCAITSNIAVKPPSTITAPEVPPSLWQPQSEGVALAMTFKSQKENGMKKYDLHVYIKNTSKKVISIFPLVYDSGVRIFYVDGKGVQIPLHDYSKKIIIDNSSLLDIRPGEILERIISLTSNEVDLVKTHPVKCVFIMWEEGKHYKIESSPITLAETVNK